MHPSQVTAEAVANITHNLSELSNTQTQRCIHKLHKHLRNINDEAYEPEIISIGPYHHGKDNLQMMEEQKLRYFEILLHRKEQYIEQYISAIGELENNARSCYGEPISLSQAKFIEMLVLDGCFIIELITTWNHVGSYRENDPIFRMDWIINSLQRDLILFENQIPFFVLCKLFDLIEAPNQHSRLIHLILYFTEDLCPYPGAEERRYLELVLEHKRQHLDPKKIKHLLDLVYIDWCPSFNDYYVCRTRALRGNREFRIIHSAKELTDANITFEKRESGLVSDVYFENGTMLMPPLTIEDRTECFFRNLIAYEQYVADNRMSFVTEYVWLMDCLLNSAEDVKILSNCGIINNWLGENEVVATIFNKLTDSVPGAGMEFMYSEMIDRINTHFKRRRNRAMAVLRRDYFNSPWAYIAFFSALFLLLLTVAQTGLSVMQVQSIRF